MSIVRNTLLFATLVLVAVVLGSCSKQVAPKGPTGPSGVLQVFNWQDYIPEDVITDFKKEYPNIKLVYDTFGSNEDMYQKILNGADYDVVFPSTDFVPRMLAGDLLAEIDPAKVPELVNVVPFINEKNTWDSGNKHSVPYNLGATAVVYWKDQVSVSEAEKSWNFLANPKYAKKGMAMDDEREILGGALKYNGYSVNSQNPAEISKAKDTVKTWKKTLIKFDNDLIKKAFATREIQIAFNYPENIAAELDPADIPKLGFFFPKEGGMMYLDVMTIMKKAKNVDNAYLFINYILRPEIQARIDDAYGYPGIYPKSVALRKNKPWYTVDLLKDHEIRGSVGDAIGLYDKAWAEIRSGQ